MNIYLKIVLCVEIGVAPCLEDAFIDFVMLTLRARSELYGKSLQYFTFQSEKPFSKSNVRLLKLFSVSKSLMRPNTLKMSCDSFN
jgi:hypothetical protein